MLLKAKLWASQLNNATDCDASEQGMIGFWKNIINTNAFPLATINQSSAKPQALYTKKQIAMLRVEWFTGEWKQRNFVLSPSHKGPRMNLGIAECD